MTTAANRTFLAIRDFWRSAFALMPRDVTSYGPKTNAEWMDSLWDGEGSGSVRSLFSNHIPEPYFGRWTDDTGRLDLAGKVVLAFINPGGGVPWTAYADTGVSTLDRAIPDLFHDFYVNGHVQHVRRRYWLLYQRNLCGRSVQQRASTKWAWAWWKSKWPNILKFIGEHNDADEEAKLVTLELVAYSSRNASKITSKVVREIRSSLMVVDLVARLAMDIDCGHRGVLLAGKRRVWDELLRQRHNMRFSPVGTVPSRVHRLELGRTPTATPVYAVDLTAGMHFPIRAATALQFR